MAMTLARTTTSIRPSRSLLILLVVVNVAWSYHKKPCTRQDRAQFQFDDCYLPPMDDDLALTEASFLFSHDAATGYIHAGLNIKGISMPYSKNQVGSVYEQLQSGARALDLRPRLLANGTIIMAHGDILIPVTLRAMVEEAMAWCRDNPDELVLLVHSEGRYPSYNATMSDLFAALETTYAELGVAHETCGTLYASTIGQVKELAQLPLSDKGEKGGYLLALDGQYSQYSSSCVKANWSPNQLVTCWSNQTSASCKSSHDPFEKLDAYLLASANSEATDDWKTLGPPASLQETPLWQVQALWQVDTHAAAAGIAHFSTLLKDNRESDLNYHVVQLIYSGVFDQLSLLAVDNVGLHGNALTSVMRTRCGQSSLQDICDHNIDPPRIHRHSRWHASTGLGVFLQVLALCYATWIIVWMIRNKRPVLLWTLVARLLQNGNDICTQGDGEQDDDYYARGGCKFDLVEQSRRCQADWEPPPTRF